MSEIIFVVEEAAEGGTTARSLGASIFAEADTLAALHEDVRDAVRCHKSRVADALIAQSCIDHGVPLITRDRDFRHYVRVGGLRRAGMAPRRGRGPRHPGAL